MDFQYFGAVLILVAFAAHEITTTIDVSYADPKRDIAAPEQRVHDYLTAIPMTAMGLVVVTNAQEFMRCIRAVPRSGN
jgi:hypothetical protein